METNQEFRPIKSRYLVITLDYLIPLFVVIGVIFCWWVVFSSQLFSIKHITCQLDYEPCQNENVLTELNKSLGKNLFHLDTSTIVSRLKSSDYTLRLVGVQKSLPDNLRVELNSVFPTVAARVIDNPTWVTFDDDLRLIATRSADPNVPVLIVKELKGVAIGKKSTDDSLNTALTITKNVASELPGIKTISQNGDNLELTLGSGMHAVMTTTKDFGDQIRALQAVLADVTILTGVSTIDVRFTQPVLR